MRTLDFFIIIISCTLTGWLISWLIIKIIFAPVKAIYFFGIKLYGLIPAFRFSITNKVAAVAQKEFMAYKGLEEKVGDPDLFAKLKPEIEEHIDHFLKQKLKTVFPLLSQFMGEKTLSQFKEAFLAEIDNLFPSMMKNYIGVLKNDIRLDTIISEKLNSISTEDMRDTFYKNAKKGISFFKVICMLVGLIAGIISAGIIYFIG